MAQPSSREIRLPLQVGTSAAASLLRVGLGLVPGLVLTVSTWLLWQAEHPILGALSGLIGVQLIALGVANLIRARRMRASDALVSDAGVRFEGGPHHGLRLSWEELDPKRTGTSEERVDRLTGSKVFANLLFGAGNLIFTDTFEGAPPENVKVMRLGLGPRGREPLMVAEADTPGEMESLRALADSIDARLSPTQTPAPADPRLLRCHNCGALLTPAAAQQVACSYCNAPNAVPPQLAQQVAASQQLESARSSAGQLIAKLLDQPGAHRINVVLTLMAALTLLMWLLPLGIMIYTVYAGVEDYGFEIGWLLLNGLVIAVAIHFFARMSLVNRGALRLLTLGFAARAPAAPGQPHGCRNCMAPLVASDAQLITRCVYCNADNVLGVDLRHRANVAATEQRDLDATLEQRKSKRVGAVITGVGTLALGLLSTAAVIPLIGFAQDEAEARAVEPADCKKGKRKACRLVAEKYYFGKGVEADEEIAEVAAKRACDDGDGSSCDLLALIYGKDDERWRPLMKKACKLDYEPACEDLKKR